MKSLFNSKITLLTVFLLLLVQPMKADALENALGAFYTSMLILGGLVLLSLIFLIVFIVNRKKTTAIVSGVLAFMMLVAGLWLSWTMDDYNGNGFSFIGNSLKIAGIANLALVFALSFAFLKNKNVLVYETEDKKPVDAKGYRTIQWLSALFIFWFFFSFYESLEFLRTVFRWSEFSVVQPSEIFMAVMDFVPLVLLLIALLLFIKRKRAGWSLLVFYNIYVLVGYLVFMARNAFFSPNEKFHVPTGIYIAQTVILIFLSFCLWLLTMAGVRVVFAVSKRSSLVALTGSIALTVGLMIISQVIISII